jgi:hypothetical protein
MHWLHRFGSIAAVHVGVGRGATHDELAHWFTQGIFKQKGAEV